MKKLKITLNRQYWQDVELKITKVIHDLPTWMFPEFIGSALQHPCPICHQEMGLNIGHGEYMEKCSVIQVDGFYVYPIHTECYNKIVDSDELLTQENE